MKWYRVVPRGNWHLWSDGLFGGSANARDRRAHGAWSATTSRVATRLRTEPADVASRHVDRFGRGICANEIDAHAPVRSYGY